MLWFLQRSSGVVRSLLFFFYVFAVSEKDGTSKEEIQVLHNIYLREKLKVSGAS